MINLVGNWKKKLANQNWMWDVEHHLCITKPGYYQVKNAVQVHFLLEEKKTNKEETKTFWTVLQQDSEQNMEEKHKSIEPKQMQYVWLLHWINFFYEREMLKPHIFIRTATLTICCLFHVSASEHLCLVSMIFSAAFPFTCTEEKAHSNTSRTRTRIVKFNFTKTCLSGVLLNLHKRRRTIMVLGEKHAMNLYFISCFSSCASWAPFRP